MSGKGTKLSTISENDDRFHIWKDIEGMCQPLNLPFVDNNQNYIINHVKWKNLYPYLKHIDGSMGFFLKQPNGLFKLPAKSTFRMMFCSRNYSIAPEKNIPENNRFLVKDSNGNDVEICYWPDEFLNIKMTKSSSSSSSSSSSNPIENQKQNLGFLKKTSFNLFYMN